MNATIKEWIAQLESTKTLLTDIGHYAAADRIESVIIGLINFPPESI